MPTFGSTIYSQSSNACNGKSAANSFASLVQTASKAPTENALPTLRVPSTSPRATLAGDDATTSPDRTLSPRCATVTMMLAKRITRNAWSVEDEHYFEPNHMNVWQTLEFLSSITLRKRYNYEGYNDNNNSIQALAPSWRRDSFVEKNVNPNVDEASTSRKSSGGSATGGRGISSAGSGKYALKSGNVNASSHPGGGNFSDSLDVSGVENTGGGGTGAIRNRGSSSSSGQTRQRKNSKHNNVDKRRNPNKSSVRRKRRCKQKLLIKEIDTEYALSPTDYADLIKCT